MCDNFSSPWQGGDCLKCSLAPGHTGPHRSVVDGRPVSWIWSRHQCCSIKIASLSEKQQELIAHMMAHPFPLMRLPGGYWTTTDLQPLSGNRLPEKWFGTRTVEAVCGMGLIRNETAQPFWKGRFKLVS